MIPVYGFMEGDTLGLLILAQDGDTVGDLAERLQSAAAVRVRRKSAIQVLHQGRALDLKATLTQAGIEPLDRFDVVGG